MITYGVLGFLLVVAGSSYAQVQYVPVPVPVPVFNYPGMQYPVGFGQPGVGAGQTAFSTRFGPDAGNSVGTYAFSSPGTGVVGGTYGGGLQSRFNDDDGGVVTTRFNPQAAPGVQSSSTFVSSSNVDGQAYHQSSSSVSKDGLTTTYHNAGSG